ncbi:hypothetical protein ASPWEDRAFT_27676 [Aspergillus wentii DTO 134E9]|uniref:GAT domain-containing protein n=1 Tax=Aspergillus wentii DTO 134E9 TaxID=1073089 RepID=A0A1L9RJH1_ASPWE|nr:uncharacterized protein ASPWEDRAFT_27676 [Aspergillus wentii DTO 134E9]OJJ34997.1 hypothetical protein ASPWEDRAFT_27676 [Aspergillus wentii DTO 134E9]
MKRILGKVKRPGSSSPSNYPEDSPEGMIIREVSAFCESGGPNGTNGDEFVHLPAIVETAECSPNAAKEAAYRIRKYLGSPTSPHAYVQYNAIMLLRILVDNPGHTFTRNIDAKFVSTVRGIVRDGRDMNVQRFLCETLEALEARRSWDEDLGPLLEMWKKEKGSLRGKANVPYWPSPSQPPQVPPHPRQSEQPGRQNYFAVSQASAALPQPDELAARIAEAKTSAKLLLQFVQSTPPADIAENELIKEFSDRCRSASRSVQEYIHATNPAPDEDTLMTLIETNDELSVSLSKYQHSLLGARKAVGSSTASSSSEATASGARPVPAPATESPAPRRQTQDAPSPVSTLSDQDNSISRYGSVVSNGTSSRSEYRSEDYQVQNPFADSNTYTIPEHAVSHHTTTSPVDGWSNGAINDIQNVSRREV